MDGNQPYIRMSFGVHLLSGYDLLNCDIAAIRGGKNDFALVLQKSMVFSLVSVLQNKLWFFWGGLFFFARCVVY